MPVVSVVEITAAAVQIGIVGTAIFAVYVLIFGLKVIRKVL